ncbi:MAG: replicative DNA helicase [Planctomycetes bacterium]|nr:replicative DNA helicase [Planctomycetota bacterium]
MAQPPNLLHDPEAEQCVLGSMLLARDREGIPDLIEAVAAEDFHEPRHVRVFETILAVYDRNEGIDFVTVGDELARLGLLDAIGGREYLIQLSGIVPTTAHALAHARIVRRLATLRRLRDAAAEILRSTETPKESVEVLLDQAEARIFDLATKGTRSAGLPVRDVLRKVMGQIIEQRSRGRIITGLSTGFYDLDERTAGLHPGELFILAARPSMGKTALGLDIARNVARNSGKAVAIFSLEMSSDQVAQRMLCAVGDVDAHRLRMGILTDGEYARLGEADATLSELPIFIDDDPELTPFGLRARTRRFHRRAPLGLVVVDYLQLIRAPWVESRQQEVSLISRSLKSLARELEIPVLALAQLNRGPEDRDDKRPRLSDLRESGSIEQEADVVGLLYREDYYRGKGSTEKEGARDDPAGAVELLIAKQRNGPTGSVRLRFSPEFVRFDSATLSAAEPLSVP